MRVNLGFGTVFRMPEVQSFCPAQSNPMSKADAIGAERAKIVAAISVVFMVIS